MVASHGPVSIPQPVVPSKTAARNLTRPAAGDYPLSMKSVATVASGTAKRLALSHGEAGAAPLRGNDRRAEMPKATPAPRLKLRRRAGQPSVFSGGHDITRDDVSRILEDEP